MTRLSTGLRLVMFAAVSSTSLTGLAAQTTTGGRPVRTLPAPSATPAPTPTATPTATASPAAQTAPAPIRLRLPQPAATPAPPPAPAEPAKATTGSTSVSAASAPAKADVAAPGPGGVPTTLQFTPFAKRPSDPPRGGVDEIVPSARQVPPRVPDQVEMATGTYRPQKALIRPGRFADQLKLLGPTRAITLGQLKSNPRFTLGKTQVDMSRVLANPQSVANRAAALGKLSDVVRVNSTAFDVTEVKTGLIVRSFVNYSLRPGACTVQARRIKLEAAGVRCATVMTRAERDKAFATPGNPRYVADPAQRAQAIAEAEKEAKQLEKDVAALRADLKIPQLRAEMVAALGEAEVQRIEALSDADLAAEIANSGDTKIEDVSYIPLADTAETFTPAVKLGLVPPPMPGGIAEQFDLGTQYFLAGFTFGREYEWRLRVEQRIKRCLVGCEKTYFVEAFAGFNYGLGLRFPIEVTGKANFAKASGGTTTASVTPVFRAFDGQAEHYLKAGLPSEKLFNAQEFVAQFGAHAGFGFDIPFYPPLSVAYSRQVDFTSYLDGIFKGGNFAPPNPGEKLNTNIVLSDIDLIGGRANFGFVGAQVFPAANFILGSNKLAFTIADRNSGVTVKEVTSGETVSLKPDPTTSALEFDIKDPVYNLTLTVEPGINARVFVDIGLWGKTWDLPVFFPSLALTIPSGGVTFACHDGTVCSRDYTLSPDSKKIALQGVARWASQFESRWFAACRDYICETKVRSITAASEPALKSAITTMKQPVPNDLMQDPKLAAILTSAENSAKAAWGESINRRFGIEFEPTYLGKCADDACRNAIRTTRTETSAAIAKLLQAGDPPPQPGKVVLGLLSTIPAQVSGAEVKARATVANSLNAKIAAAKDKWIGEVKAGYDKQCQADERCLYELALTADAMGGEAARLSKLSPDLPPQLVVNEVIKTFRPRFEKSIGDASRRTVK